MKWKCDGCKKEIDYQPITLSPDPDADGVCYECLSPKQRKAYDEFCKPKVEVGTTKDKSQIFISVPPSHYEHGYKPLTGNEFHLVKIDRGDLLWLIDALLEEVKNET